MIEPPYPAETRAKGWRFELDYEAIEQSDTWHLAAEVPMAQQCLLMMWLTAWSKQTPCGSLPSDENLIRAVCKIPADVWPTVREVLMRGWRPATDGRLYHDTLVKRVLEMMGKRRSDSDRQAAKRAREALESAGSHADVTRDKAVTPTEVLPESSTDHRPPNTEEEKEPPSPRKRGKPAAPAWTPPDWVPRQEWADFEAMRRAMRGVPFTDAAREGVVAELAKLQQLGHDPPSLLRAAVTNGWRTVYPPRSHAGGAAALPANRQEAIEERNRKVGDQWLAEQERADADR